MLPDQSEKAAKNDLYLSTIQTVPPQLQLV